MNELTNQLALSIQFQAMKTALQQNLVLMRKEYESLKPSRTCSAPISRIMMAEAEKWRQAIEASEKALKPVEVPVSLPEPIAELRCASCEQVTPGTIDGLCLGCDEIKASAESVTPCNCPSCAGMVVERDQREHRALLLQMARRPQ
jgi:hypothetical protein